MVFLEEKKLEKNLIYYIPGQRGAVFTYQAGNLVNDAIVNDTMDMLSEDMGMEIPIEFVEDRRLKNREIA